MGQDVLEDPNVHMAVVFTEYSAASNPPPRDYKALMLQGAAMAAGEGIKVAPPELERWAITDGSNRRNQVFLGQMANQARMEEIELEIGNALPEGDGDYDDGYRVALESITLALASAGVDPSTLREAVLTALDAHTNNAAEALKPR